ncbi:unnamed protein product, partial [Prorocentrum cordatum]
GAAPNWAVTETAANDCFEIIAKKRQEEFEFDDAAAQSWATQQLEATLRSLARHMCDPARRGSKGLSVPKWLKDLRQAQDALGEAPCSAAPSGSGRSTAQIGYDPTSTPPVAWRLQGSSTVPETTTDIFHENIDEAKDHEMMSARFHDGTVHQLATYTVAQHKAAQSGVDKMKTTKFKGWRQQTAGGAEVKVVEKSLYKVGDYITKGMIMTVDGSQKCQLAYCHYDREFAKTWLEKMAAKF